MQIDELRGELTSLADEIEPFAGDVRALRQREQRRRVVLTSLIIVLVAAVGVSTLAIVRHSNDDRVRITGEGAKEVAASDLSHFDAIIVPAMPNVQQLLDSSPAVARYARIPRADRVLLPDLVGKLTREVLCSLHSNDGYAVQSSTQPGGPDALDQILGGAATTYDVSDYFGTDLEVFMDVGASDGAIAKVRAAISPAPGIDTVRFISHADAYAIFTKDFADQPDLLKSTKPADLPVSFRINVEPGTSVSATVDRFQSLASVATVISAAESRKTFFFFPNAFNDLSFPMPTLGSSDAEVFLEVDASPSQIESVRAALDADPDVTSSEFVDKARAYSMFKTEFADEPEILKGMKPSDLPVSFRVVVNPGASVPALVERYQPVAGVATVVTTQDTLAGQATASSTECAKP